MSKGEIRINIFYSDLFVFDFSRHKHQLDNMIKSANEFFGKYKLRIDPFPFPYDYTLYKEAFVFAQSNGVKPDMGRDKLAQTMRADEAELNRLNEEYSSVNTTAERKIEILKRKEQIHKKASDQVWDGINHNSEYDFRILLGEKFKRDKILKKHEKEWAKTPRLSIVLCEFITLPQKSKLNKDVIGEYLDALSGSKIKTYSSFKRPIPAFQQPFIIMDIRAADWHTLAHEIVHGNGHVHPSGDHGGYYDGPQESIMNYFSSGLKPSEVILEEADLKSLNLAFFVR